MDIVKNSRVITDEMCVELCKITQLPEKSWFHVLAIMAGKGFRKTCKMILRDKVRENNIERCISEYNEFAFYKSSGIYNAVFTQLNHYADIKNNQQ